MFKVGCLITQDIDAIDWSMFECISLTDEQPKVPCVYLLMFDNELVYVGHTMNLKRRLYTHTNYMNSNSYLGNKKIGVDSFNKILYRIIETREERKQIEKKYTEAFEPKLCSCGLYSPSHPHKNRADYIRFRLNFGMEKRWNL